MGYAESSNKRFSVQRLLALHEKLPLWASYFVVVLCAFGMGYSMGAARTGFADPGQRQIALVVLAAAALLIIFSLDRLLRSEERRRAEHAEQLRVAKEAMAIELLDPVERRVLDALDEIASIKGVDRATLIPAVLSQYIARKSFEAALLERAAQRNEEPEVPPGWFKTLPAWLETLPGSLDVKSR